MSLFDARNYRDYLRTYLRTLPNGGRGALTKIANHLQINTTLLSQIMSGTRDFNLDQAHELNLYLGHTELESEYFFLLIQIERAGTEKLKAHLHKKLESIRREALKLSRRVTTERKLTEEERAVFYSSWLYSAIHLFSSTKQEGVTIEEAAHRFMLSRTRATEVLKFLSQAGFCKENESRYTMSVQSTFLEQGSPHLIKHHANWRVKAIQKSESVSESELMFSGQVSLSKNDFALLREKLAEFLKTAAKVTKESEPEDIACLNLDWFWIEK